MSTSEWTFTNSRSRGLWITCFMYWCALATVSSKEWKEKLLLATAILVSDVARNPHPSGYLVPMMNPVAVLLKELHGISVVVDGSFVKLSAILGENFARTLFRLPPWGVGGIELALPIDLRENSVKVNWQSDGGSHLCPLDAEDKLHSWLNEITGTGVRIGTGKWQESVYIHL